MTKEQFVQLPEGSIVNESDIPAEWRIPDGAGVCTHPLCSCQYRCKYETPRGAILKTEFTESESEQVELDRR